MNGKPDNGQLQGEQSDAANLVIDETIEKLRAGQIDPRDHVIVLPLLQELMKQQGRQLATH